LQARRLDLDPSRALPYGPATQRCIKGRTEGSIRSRAMPEFIACFRGGVHRSKLLRQSVIRRARRAQWRLFERACDLPNQHAESSDSRYETCGSSKVEPMVAGAGVDEPLPPSCHWRHSGIRRTGGRLLATKPKSRGDVPKTPIRSAGTGPRHGNNSRFGFAIDRARHGTHLRNPHARSARPQRLVMFRIL